jgi:hypothetical protein
VEEIVASGGPPGQMLPPGRSPKEKVFHLPYLVGKVASFWKGASHSPKCGSCISTERDWGA